MNVLFSGIESERIRKIFLGVLSRYEELHAFEIMLRQQQLRSSTMNAQPVIGLKSLFTGVRRYRIVLGTYIRNAKTLRVDELPDVVLEGWFAHELGHIVDYGAHSNGRMLVYGLKYLISPAFRRQAEHRADRIAIDKGFHDEIISSKEFILNHDLIDTPYKTRIRKYYMSVEDVRLCIAEDQPIQPVVDLDA